MAMATTTPLHSTIFTPFNPSPPHKTLSFLHHRTAKPRQPLTTAALAVKETSNGAVVGTTLPDAEFYGRQYFPLAAVVGQDEIKTALLLGAIDREIGGIAICGKRGTAKTVMARGLHAILPPIEVVVGSIANADPTCPEEWEIGLADQLKYDYAGNVKTEIVRTPFIQIPLGVTEDRLIGSVDVEESVRTGTTVFQPGLLAEAHRGVLYVDEINLLDEGISNLLLNVLTEGVNTVEREGISFRHPCKPLLIATYNPEEGSVREHLLDRVAINLSADVPMSFDNRVAAVGIATEFQDSSKAVFKLVEEEAEFAKTQIILAREYLKEVSISREQLKYLVMESLRGGCQRSVSCRFPKTFFLANALMLMLPSEVLAETCDADSSLMTMPALFIIALIGATVGGLVARQRKGELTRLNDQLRQINEALRRQAKIESYAPNLSYAPVGRASEVTEVIVDPRKQQLLTHLRTGKNYLRNQDPEKAFTEFKAALKLAKSLEDHVEEKKAARGLGASLQRQGKYKDAIKYHSRVLEICKRAEEDSGSTEAFGAIADCYTEIGDLEQAGKFYDQYIARLKTD